MISQSFFPQATTRHFRSIKAPIPSDDSSFIHQTQPLANSNQSKQNLPVPREVICQFFLNIVKQSTPDAVLSEFKNLFIQLVTIQSEPQRALYEIIISNDEEEFKNTLKRSIYIILNNWIFSRNYKSAHELMELLAGASINCCTSPALNNLNTWLGNFVNSQDYQEIKLFVDKYDYREKEHWKSRYTSYLLTSEYTDSNKPVEQRKAARTLSKQLQDKFKFDLAMYTAHSHHVGASTAQTTQNPTVLGDEALRLIKQVVSKRSFFSYANLANIFLKQTQRLQYKYFKQSLMKYLFFSVSNQGLVNNLQTKLSEKLDSLYQDYHEEPLNKPLLLKTCNRVIEWLTMPRNGEPSSLFIALASQGNPLTLAIILLKITLICPATRTHLEVCMANLVQYYEDYSQEECHWVIKFLEITKIILTIFTENVRYNLVNMEAANQSDRSSTDEDSSRIFSQQSKTKRNPPQ